MKSIISIITIVLLSILLVGTAYILKNEELCCRYDLCKQITDICVDEIVQQEEGTIESVKGVPITLSNIKSGQTVTAGTEIEGSVTGSWYWEGVFTVKVLDRQGEELDVLLAQAKEDTYTEEEVPFSFLLDVDLEQESVVVLKFEKSNPSALEEYDDYAQISVTIIPQIEQQEETISVKVFFPNIKIDSKMLDCSLVFPVTRKVPETLAVGRAALLQLLGGTTVAEGEEGYFTNIPEGVEIQSLTVEDGVAKVDFSSELEQGVGGSCRVNSIRAQIEETLKQFGTVDSVVISIDGKTEDILQP